jgi:hypothetical protein
MAQSSMSRTKTVLPLWTLLKVSDLKAQRRAVVVVALAAHRLQPVLVVEEARLAVA